MSVFEESVKINNLFDVYGAILTKKQQIVLQMYYQFDSSLSEIATELNISRQAVHDTINKSVKLLQDLEEKIGMIAKLEEIKTNLINIDLQAKNLYKDKLKNIIDSI